MTTDRKMTPVPPDDEDFMDDQEERDEDAGDTLASPLEVMSVAISKHWSEMHAGQAQAEQIDRDQWTGVGVIEPSYSPRGLMWLYRNSSSLRANIEAIAHNVDGFGWTSDPVFDFDAEDLRSQVSTAMYLDAHAAWEIACLAAERAGDSMPPEPEMPGTSEVDETIKKWRMQAAIEKEKMKLHFGGACFEHSFVDLRKRTRVDKECFGWGAWEVVRSSPPHGRPVRYLHVPAQQIRVMAMCDPIWVEEKVKTSTCSYQTIKVQKRFRIVVQQEEDGSEQPVRFFRQYGDPRIVSSVSGAVFATCKDLKKAEGKDAVPANEILLFMDYFPGSAYGAPRHHGVIPELKGAWLAANHVVDYLENSAIPRGILLVNDGRLNKRSVRDVKNYFGTVKGKAENRIAVIQAETPRDRALEGSGRVKMEWVDLSGAQRDDATFMKYDERVANKVAQQYRLPPLLRGETRDFNRATAIAAMQFAEEQVFSPDRNSFDWVMNRFILPELGVRFWRFRSSGPSKQDPEVLSKVMEVLLKQGVVVPAEVRPVAERMLSQELLRVAGDWQQLPISLVQQGFKPPTKKPAIGEDSDTLPDKEDDDIQPPEQVEEKEGGELLKREEAMVTFRRLVGSARFDTLVKKHLATLEAEQKAIGNLSDPDGD